jgi:hypothetical protein
MTGEFAFQSLLLSEDVKGAGVVRNHGSDNARSDNVQTRVCPGRVLRDFAKQGADAAL